MAVIAVEEIFDSSGSLSDTELSTERRFNVYVDGPDRWPVVVAGFIGHANGVAIGDVHPDTDGETDEPAYCLDIGGSPDLQQTIVDEDEVLPAGRWVVTAQYKTLAPGSVQPGLSPVYPTTPAMYSGSGSFEDVPVDYDKNGDPIQTTAGAPFLTPLMRKRVSKQMECEVNLSSPPDYTQEGKVNDATFQGGAAGTVLMGPISFSGPYVKNGVSYNTYRFTYLYAAETWDVRHGKVLMEGLHEATDDGPKVIQENGCDITEPKYLDEDGHVTDTPEFKTFELYETATFTVY